MPQFYLTPEALFDEKIEMPVLRLVCKHILEGDNFKEYLRLNPPDEPIGLLTELEELAQELDVEEVLDKLNDFAGKSSLHFLVDIDTMPMTENRQFVFPIGTESDLKEIRFLFHHCIPVGHLDTESLSVRRGSYELATSVPGFTGAVSRYGNVIEVNGPFLHHLCAIIVYSNWKFYYVDDWEFVSHVLKNEE